ncbi:MAG: hypothetical protein WC469_02435 [Candidatus Omnitrophota bacterium]|jgi:hypothetical protein
MDEVLIAELLRRISLVTSVIGILVGVDLIFGAKVFTKVKKFLDRVYNFDSVISKPRIRVGLGIFMLFLCALMMLLLLVTK